MASSEPGPVDENPTGEGDEEFLLFQAYRESPGPEIQEKIVARYSRLVISLVRKFRGRAEWEDLLQIGYLGLLKAIQGFDQGSGYRFSTYASHCVSGELRHYLRDKNETIRRPRWLQAISKKVGLFVEQFTQTHERLPTPTEISEGCNLAQDSVLEVLRASRCVSLEKFRAESGETYAAGKVKALREESFVLSLEDKIWIESALNRLLDLEKSVLVMFFFRDFNQSQIAGATGLSPKKVSRTIQRGLKRLKGLLGLNEEASSDA